MVSLNIRCTNEVLKAGDEIPIEFIITNRGPNDFKYVTCNYDRSGRMNTYKLTAATEVGETVADPRANRGYHGGGIGGFAYLMPGQSLRQTILLNLWALVEGPGRYVVVGTYREDAYFPASINSDPIFITVLPRTDAEMDDYINSLTNQLLSLLPGGNAGQINHPEAVPLGKEALVKKLMFTGSPKIVPALLQTIYDSGEADRSVFWATEAFFLYLPHSPEIGKVMIEFAIRHGLGPPWIMPELLNESGATTDDLKPLIERSLAADHPQDWVSGAQLAGHYGDDAFNPRLIAIATTPESDARAEAIAALGNNRTDEGVKTLRALMNDPDPKIWTPLAVAVVFPGEHRNGSLGTPMRDDDFNARDVKPLIERMLASYKEDQDCFWGLRLAEQFGDDDFTPGLIAIATNTNYFYSDNAIFALAFNRTDEGVKTLRKLLNDGGPEIRKRTEEAIRDASTKRGKAQGRPLRPEDFDAALREAK